MKRYISAILIPCLIMQFFGCYSFRDISLNELRTYSGDNDVMIRTYQEEIVINRKTTQTKSMSWESGDSSIIVSSKELIKSNDSITIDNKKYEIKYESVINSKIEERDSFATLAFVLGATAITIYLIAAIVVASDGVLGN